MGNYHFFAMMARMKYIKRWSLMHNWDDENISEHSLEVAMISHALAVINNVRMGGNVDPDRAAVLGMFHDTTEIITGDMPTPVKYFNPVIKNAYKDVENIAAEKLLEMLPEDMREYYRDIYNMDCKDGEYDSSCYMRKLIKAADKLSALIKCIKEEKMGNFEFTSALKSTQMAIEKMNLPEVSVFMEEFLDSFELTLDELQGYNL